MRARAVFPLWPRLHEESLSFPALVPRGGRFIAFMIVTRLVTGCAHLPSAGAQRASYGGPPIPTELTGRVVWAEHGDVRMVLARHTPSSSPGAPRPADV